MPATKAQRLKHLPTGLYYIPSREVKVKVKQKDGTFYETYCKSNLSKTGKVYVRGASFRFIDGGISSHIEFQRKLQYRFDNEIFSPFDGSCRRDQIMKFNPDDWVIEDFNN